MVERPDQARDKTSGKGRRELILSLRELALQAKRTEKTKGRRGRSLTSKQSIRIKRKGYKIAIIPQAEVWHDVSTAKDFHLDEERAFFRGRNRARFYFKYAPLRILLLPIDMLGFCAMLYAFDKSPRRLKKICRYFKGIIHGLV